jgi:hypothetical protein
MANLRAVLLSTDIVDLGSTPLACPMNNSTSLRKTKQAYELNLTVKGITIL